MMSSNTDRSKKLMTLALSMPKHENFMIEQYRDNPTYARARVQEEFQEYVETDDIRYLLSTLRKVAEAKGWSALSRETGLSRSVLYAALSGERDPQIGTVMKILKALGVRVLTNVILRTKAKPSRRNPDRPHTHDVIHTIAAGLKLHPAAMFYP